MKKTTYFPPLSILKEGYSKNRMAFFLLLMTGLFIVACQRELNLNPDEENQEEVLIEEPTVLGKKLENPFSVSNMKKAYDNLKVNAQGKLADNGFEIKTTDLYVRFFPESLEELELLEKDSLNLFNFPLDYEIESYGESYKEPGEESKIERWYYTSVPADYEFPNVKHELLEDLFLPESYENNENNARLSSFMRELEEESLKITGNFQEPEKGKQLPNARTRENPRGFVRVWDSESQQLVPVVGVKVRTRWWFRYGNAYTSNSGFYYITTDYRYNPNYSVIFANRTGFKVWSSMINISVAQHNLGEQNKRGLDINIFENSRAWRMATVNNGAVKYRNYCSRFGITLPPSNLRIAATDRVGWSSAPMLRRTWGLYGFTTNSDLANFFLKANKWSLGINALATITKFIQPDVIIAASSSNGTARVYEAVFHELAHGSHFSRVGSSYWVKYINYIITYGSYGNGSGRNHGLCALGEAWGYYIGWRLTLEEFDGVRGTRDNSEMTWNLLERFTPLERPDDRDIERFRVSQTDSRINSARGWIPVGTMHDLIDNVSDFIRTGFRDNVSGYTIRELNNALDRDVDTPQKFRDRLLRNSNNRQGNEVNNLFEAYFWD